MLMFHTNMYLFLKRKVPYTRVDVFQYYTAYPLSIFLLNFLFREISLACGEYPGFLTEVNTDGTK